MYKSRLMLSMRNCAALLLFLFVPSLGLQAQRPQNTSGQGGANENLTAQRTSLTSDLRNLDEQAINLSPLARALAKAEIAEAAWTLDNDWARSLLTKAYELTFPSEEERITAKQPPGSRPTPPGPIDRARRNLRSRVLTIAGRDKSFADGLLRLGLEQLGTGETYATYTSLAHNARQQEDIDTASDYLLRAAEIDPSQITVGFTIADIAKTDRRRADNLIVSYFDRLRRFPLSRFNASTIRVFLVVNRLIFPSDGTPAPGPRAMAAYASFVIEGLNNLEVREPGSLIAYRSFLLKARDAVTLYAPNLMTDFLVLEQRSRSLNDAGAPSPSNPPQDKRQADIDEATEIGVNEAIGGNDFDKARKLVDKLRDGPRKNQLSDKINAKEALHLTKKGELPAARVLAQKLNNAMSVRQVYVTMIETCVAAKDQICASELMLQAVKQLKQADKSPWIPPEGIPSTVVPTATEQDPVLDGLAKLTLSVTPINIEIALLGLGETIAAANKSEVDTSQGRVGFDPMVFRKLAPKAESRVRQEAESLRDPLRRITALAAIFQWKASELAAQLQAR